MEFIISLLPTMKSTTCVSSQAGRQMRWEEEGEEEEEEGEEEENRKDVKKGKCRPYGVFGESAAALSKVENSHLALV